MHTKEINIPRKTVHQFGFIYKNMQGCRSTKHKNYVIEYGPFKWLSVIAHSAGTSVHFRSTSYVEA
jgi:hypothetical protein